MKLKRFYMDWYCGIKSNIPICCIVFYNLFWKHRVKDTKPTPKIISGYGKLSSPIKIQYIRCPICVITHKVREIKLCNWYKCMGIKLRCSIIKEE